jgi:hypothetical protein
LVCLKTISSFCSGVKRLWHKILITILARVAVAEDIVISMVVSPFLGLKNSDGTEF